MFKIILLNDKMAIDIICERGPRTEMVTAIVIPIICIYFYVITKKEMKKQDQKWLETGQIPLESVVSGEIKSISDTKQRFYYHRFIYVQEIKLQSNTKLITAKKITPLTKGAIINTFQSGEMIRAYGRWKNNQFYINHFENLSHTNFSS
jgi:hypothetical protein